MTDTEPLDLDALPVGAVFANPESRIPGAVWEVVSDCLDGTEIRYQSTGGDEVFNTHTLTRGGATFVALVDATALIAELRRLREEASPAPDVYSHCRHCLMDDTRTAGCVGQDEHDEPCRWGCNA
ncbi:hypothetical protein [Rathayibacter sp. Leaf248]|uniref:hypothetical protein n=1 Tax=Rathayibacter sp. Leaf248 TaxID=2876555 RepID=UPI001E34AE9A|nr:hypothetical protein [Rathayibacter sp. Leaf248]